MTSISPTGEQDIEMSDASRLCAMEREVARLREEVSSLANLYVSSYRLHDARERTEVLTVIQEIVISIVGSEEFAVFELDSHVDRTGEFELSPSAVFGVSEEAIAWIRRGTELVPRCLSRGTMLVRADGRDLAEGPFGSRLSALVPLRLGERIVGLVAIFSMLPHKPELTGSDLALLDLLSSHASTSLHYADLHARSLGRSEGRVTTPPVNG